MDHTEHRCANHSIPDSKLMLQSLSNSIYLTAIGGGIGDLAEKL